MDCLEFRRRLGSEPQVVDAAAQAHLAGCAGCAAATTAAQAFEARLANALAVAVPGDLANRILAAQRANPVETKQPRRRLGWIALAAAASLLLAFGVVRYQRAAQSLPDLVAAHVTAAEEHAALALQTPVPMVDVEQAFADRGVKLADVPPQVVYVAECGIGRWPSVHMVSAGEGGPVSVVYVVRERATASKDFRRDGLVAREVPIADGTLYMLAQSGQRFDALEHAWRDALEGLPKVAAGSL
ncbi:DUF3379 family protein [Dokdonella sp.]|uniref:DUF3379 family protein n=1 Tax=Dokdonella sp. TaxID=2291710 RepID=UPI003783DD44